MLILKLDILHLKYIHKNILKLRYKINCEIKCTLENICRKDRGITDKIYIYISIVCGFRYSELLILLYRCAFITFNTNASYVL